MPPNITATAAAMANVFIEPEHLLRTMVSFALRCFAATGLHAGQVFQARRLAVVEQRIFFRKADKSRGAVLGGRIRALPLRKGAVFCARSTQQPREAIVSFDAARLVINSVRLIALLGEFLLYGPGLSPHGRIFDGHDVFKRGRGGPRPALGEVQVLARAPIVGLRTEIRHVNDEGAALPMAAGVAKPLADASRQMGAPVHDDIALPDLPLTDVVEYRDAAWRLHDAAEAAAECGSKLGQPARQAALRQTAVLRAVIAVHALGVVARRKVGASRRGRRIILAAATARRLAFACLGRLQQGKTEFPVGGSHLLPLRRQPWNPAI